MKNIQKIKIKNFKSFLDEEFTFDDLTAIVGANESGKTNVLKAINEFSPKRLHVPYGREDGDFRLDSPDFPAGEISIKVEMVLNKDLIPNLIKLDRHLEGKVFWIEKRGTLNTIPNIKAGFSEKLSEVAGIIKVNGKQAFKSQMQNTLEKHQLEFAFANGWLFKDSSINLTKNPCASLLREKKIENLTDQKRDEFLGEKLLPEVTQNIRMVFWKYAEKDHYLPEKVLITDFIADPSKYPGVDAMFFISGWQRVDYQKNLSALDHTTRSQLLRNTQDRVNELIKKHWSTHRELTVKLSYNGEYLDISLSEPGHETPPNFRSDGFKWFLAFLLFFKRQAVNLNGNILLIDEPGGFLHPQGQKDVLKELIALSKENQVVYTTHQTFLINKNSPESVRIIKREKRGYGKSAYDSRVYNLQNTKHILTDKLLRESLGFLVSDISPLNESNILVEGEFDREVLIEVNKKFKILDLNEVSIISCGRASNIRRDASQYIANELNVVGLYDSDRPGQEALKNSPDDFRKTHLQKVIEDPLVETMEDALPKDTFMAGLNEWMKKVRLNIVFSDSIPRMRQINDKLTTSDDKQQHKHLLEDFLIEAVRKDIKTKSEKFEYLEKILHALKKLLDEAHETHHPRSEITELSSPRRT